MYKSAFSACALVVLCIGASFSNVAGAAVEVASDIVWYENGDNRLTLDIYHQEGRTSATPVVVVFHGGGWLINTNNIMHQTSQYLAEHGPFTVANVNYRLLGDNNNTVTIDTMAEDALGAVLWVKEHIADYGGDPDTLVVTGDSAGAHLAAMVVTAGHRLSDAGFSPPDFAFRPTYFAKGQTIASLNDTGGVNVQGAVLSYGAFDIVEAARNGFESEANIFWKLAGVAPRGVLGEGKSVERTPNAYKAVSPLYLVDTVKTRLYPPQFVHVGERDAVTPPSSVRAYAYALHQAGQPVQYRVYAGRNHAFLDNDCNTYLDVCFDRDAPQVLDDIILFIQQNVMQQQ